MRPIDADALREELMDAVNAPFLKEMCPASWAEAYESCVRALDRVPTLDCAPVVHGYWVEDDTPFVRQRKCSVCGKSDNPKTAIYGHYCWYCGAKMDGGKSDV